jgi:hypothetical protein
MMGEVGECRASKDDRTSKSLLAAVIDDFRTCNQIDGGTFNITNDYQ